MRFQLTTTYFLTLVASFFASITFAQQTINFSEEVVVFNKEQLFVNNHQQPSLSLEKTPKASQKSVVILNTKWSAQVFELTSKEDFTILKDDLLRFVNFSCNFHSTPKEKETWFSPTSNSAKYWFKSTFRLRSATQTLVAKFKLFKKSQRFYNRLLPIYYVYSNQYLYNQQVAYQPTSSYDDRLLNPMLTSFPPPLAS